MEYMAAHLSKIHGLDWHPDNEFILATSSQDNSVRVRFTSIPERTTLESKVKRFIIPNQCRFHLRRYEKPACHSL